MNGANHSKGFTLIELITVMVLVAVVAFVALPRMTTNSTTLMAARDDFVAALSYAQQLAMARDSASNPITFVAVNSRTITVRENNIDVPVGSNFYPLTLPNGVSISASSAFPVTLDYTKLGTTTPTTFTLTAASSSASVNVSATGYAE